MRPLGRRRATKRIVRSRCPTGRTVLRPFAAHVMSALDGRAGRANPAESTWWRFSPPVSTTIRRRAEAESAFGGAFSYRLRVNRRLEAKRDGYHAAAPHVSRRAHGGRRCEPRMVEG